MLSIEDNKLLTEVGGQAHGQLPQLLAAVCAVAGW